MFAIDDAVRLKSFPKYVGIITELQDPRASGAQWYVVKFAGIATITATAEELVLAYSAAELAAAA
jgi:hypothetical protein